MSAEGLLGVIMASCLRYGDSHGYSLVITTTRVVGIRKTPWLSGFCGYVGPGSHLSMDRRVIGREWAGKLLPEKEFEISKESILLVFWKEPDLADGGHVIFKTDKPNIQIELLNSPTDVTMIYVVPALRTSLLNFAPERFYDEETGVRVQDELLKKEAEKQQKVAEKQAKKALKKHWW